MALSKNAVRLLKERYCQGETPKELFKRVSSALSVGDPKFETRLYKAMTGGFFMPASPTIRNAGFNERLLHPCAVLGISDSIESIFETIKNTALLFHFGAGVGISFSPLRPKGDALSSGGETSGVLSFMEIFDKVVNCVKEGGFRKGGVLGVLDVTHPEISNFITYKLKDRLTNMNNSVMVNDDFMSKVEKNEKVALINPRDKQMWSHVGARDLFDLMAFSAHNCGDPGLLFFDRINKDNPLYPKKPMTAANLCQPADSLLLDGDKLRFISQDANNWMSWKSGKKEVLELLCNNGMRLRYTPDHEIMLKDYMFTPAKDTMGKILNWGLGNRVGKKIDSVELLRGFLFGDGFVCGGNFGVSVKLNCEKEPEVAKLLLIGGFHKQPSGAFYQNKNEVKPDVSFLNERTFNRELPRDVLFGDSNKVVSFLRGLFEANGSVTSQGQISLSATNKNMIDNVQILLASFGIISWSIRNNPLETKWKNGTYTSRISYNLQIAPRNAWIFKVRIGFMSKRKNSLIHPRGLPYYGKLKVVSIKSLGKMEVWDYRMNKPPHENFCQGVIAKNCGELPLFENLMCNLASINLSKFVKGNSFDTKKFAQYVELGTRTLLNINGCSWFPTAEITRMMKRFSPIGLGLLGMADLLIKLGIYYDSDEHLKLIDEIKTPYIEITNRIAHKSFYKRSLPPTGSVSIILDASPATEPVFDKVFERHLTIGVLEETREIYKSKYLRTAHQISPDWRLKIQSKWQNEVIDSAISSTVNLPSDTTVDQIKDIFMKAWKMGLKGICVFREGCKEGVLQRSKCAEGSKDCSL